MQNTRIMANGVTSERDVEMCVAAGSHALGFVVEFPPLPAVAPWNLDRERAAALSSTVPAYVTRVAVVGGEASEIVEIAKVVRPHVLELQADEPEAVVEEVVASVHPWGISVTKVLHLNVDDPGAARTVDWRGEMEKYLALGADAIMVDVVTGTRKDYGDRNLDEDGANFEDAPTAWPIIAPAVRDLPCMFSISGGVGIENVDSAIQILRPDVVNVMKAVESEPGKKDEALLREFMEAVARADSAHRNGR